MQALRHDLPLITEQVIFFLALLQGSKRLAALSGVVFGSALFLGDMCAFYNKSVNLGHPGRVFLAWLGLILIGFVLGLIGVLIHRLFTTMARHQRQVNG